VSLIVLGEFYFSQLQNKPIWNASGERIGRLLDMAMRGTFLHARHQIQQKSGL